MAMGKKGYAKLQKMQALCADVEADNRRLEHCLRSLKAAEKRRVALQDFYERDWLRLAESPDLSAAQAAGLQALVAEGGYSVLGQDTIWNALSDQHALRLKLLKHLAKHL